MEYPDILLRPDDKRPFKHIGDGYYNSGNSGIPYTYDLLISKGFAEYFCAGCQRSEVHKMCPAYGTSYYMSGKLFTEEMELLFKQLNKAGINPELFCKVFKEIVNEK